jgi:hypothetical protein
MRIELHLVILLAHCWLSVRTCSAGTDQFVIEGGMVLHTDVTGMQERLDVGKRCIDLWVSPHESVIAFIGIDKTRSPDEAPVYGSKQPIIDQSTIYIATRAGHFVPKAVVSRSFEIAGRSWSALREPSVTPDRQTVLFDIPISMTTWKVMRLSLSSGDYRSVGDATAYCVVWGGRYSGSVLLQRRSIRRGLPASAEAIAYRCYRVDQTGRLDMVSDDCSGFSSFADQWCREHAASCPVPPE